MEHEQGMQPLTPGAARGWQLIRWEADVPPDESETARLPALADRCMRMAGSSRSRITGAEGVLEIRLCHSAFTARLHQETAAWLCAQLLSEQCALMLEQEGTVSLSDIFDTEEPLGGEVQVRELSDWWSGIALIDTSAARTYRTGLTTLIKRRQYGALGGYISRALRNEPDLSRVCFGFVPLVIEAVWSRRAEIGLAQLTSSLDLRGMTRRPKELLLKWVSSLQGVLRSVPDSVDTEPIDRVIAGIRADCSLPYTQRNLSRSIGLTPAYFCRLFREKTGRHFSSYLTAVRMEKAQELLAASPDASLQEVSAACGYPSKSYFCQVFRRYTGMTPGEYQLVRKAMT